MSQKFEDLTSFDKQVAAEAWKIFFFNEAAVTEFLKSTPPEKVDAVLSAGASWDGTGWDTTKAAKAVRALTGLAMVTTRFQEYLMAFLFSLALCAGLEIQALELSDRASKVAFGLAKRWQGAATPANKKGKPKEEEEEEEQAHLPW